MDSNPIIPLINRSNFTLILPIFYDIDYFFLERLKLFLFIGLEYSIIVPFSSYCSSASCSHCQVSQHCMFILFYFFLCNWISFVFCLFAILMFVIAQLLLCLLNPFLFGCFTGCSLEVLWVLEYFCFLGRKFSLSSGSIWNWWILWLVLWVKFVAFMLQGLGHWNNWMVMNSWYCQSLRNVWVV